MNRSRSFFFFDTLGLQGLFKGGFYSLHTTCRSPHIKCAHAISLSIMFVMGLCVLFSAVSQSLLKYCIAAASVGGWVVFCLSIASPLLLLEGACILFKHCIVVASIGGWFVFCSSTALLLLLLEGYLCLRKYSR